MKRSRSKGENEGGDAGGETMVIMPLGAGQEVGRSCIWLKYMGKTILLDCGIHPGYNGEAALPFFDAEDFDPEEVDLLLVTHFHLDHCASLPYFTEKTGFKGRIFMTHPTKAVMRMMLADYIKLVNVSTEDILYTETDLSRCIDKIELIDFHQVLEHSGIKFWCYNAGHVLGAAMFMIEIAGVHVLYTGDYSMEDDRHLMAAEVPSISPDVLIVESTYGIQVHDAKDDREARFTGEVSKIVRRGGRCLIPVFALGRAQELLLILDEYWQKHPELHRIPVYYASRMASKALRVYQTYINMMNAHIRQQMDVANPFKFKHITNLKSVDNFDDSRPSVVMAAPGMLQNGVSRQLFDRWCENPKNGVLLAGYSVEGTLAKRLLTHPEEVTGLDGRVRRRLCSVEYVSFSAHVDFVQNKRFMDAVVPANIILVHGEQGEMRRLEGELRRKYELLPLADRPPIRMPQNTEQVHIQFHRDKVARAVGSLTTTLPLPALTNGDAQPSGSRVTGGLLVSKDFDKRLMAPQDVENYSLLKVGGVVNRMVVPFYSSFDVLVSFIREVYDDVRVEREGEETGGKISVYLGSGTCACTVTWPPASTSTTDAGAASMKDGVENEGKGGGRGASGLTRREKRLRSNVRLTVEWDASPANDMVADSIIALAMQAQSSPGGIRMTSPAVRMPCGHGRGHAHAHTHAHRNGKKEAGGGDGGGGEVEADAMDGSSSSDEEMSAQQRERAETMRKKLEVAGVTLLARMLSDSYGGDCVKVIGAEADRATATTTAETTQQPPQHHVEVHLDQSKAKIAVTIDPDKDLGWTCAIVECDDEAMRKHLALMIDKLMEALAGAAPATA